MCKIEPIYVLYGVDFFWTHNNLRLKHAKPFSDKTANAKADSKNPTSTIVLYALAEYKPQTWGARKETNSIASLWL